MRTLFLIISFALFNLTAKAQSTTENIKVYGNCGMCKERIEKALDLKGVQSANWDAKSGVLEVKYNTKKITREEIEKAISAAGHDTERFKADQKVYQQLHHCCQYERKHED